MPEDTPTPSLSSPPSSSPTQARCVSDSSDANYDPVNNSNSRPATCFTATTEIERDAQFLTTLPPPSLRALRPTFNPTPTPAFLETDKGALEINGRTPREAIIDTGASKTMFSSNFAVTVGIALDNLEEGEGFITSSGSVEKPLGVASVNFTFMRDTAHEHRVTIRVTVVDTLVYDTLLGMDFISAVKGAYDTWSETFKYRWEDIYGEFHSYEIPAPCHAKIPPPIIHAYYSDNQATQMRGANKEADQQKKVPQVDNYTPTRSPEAIRFPWIGSYDTDSEEYTATEGHFTNREYYTTGGEETAKEKKIRRTEIKTGHTLQLTKT